MKSEYRSRNRNGSGTLAMIIGRIEAQDAQPLFMFAASYLKRLAFEYWCFITLSSGRPVGDELIATEFMPATTAS